MRVLVSAELARVVDEYLAAHEPERLLHALGRVRPDGSISLTHWVLDEEAATSGVHVRASVVAERSIRAVELDEDVAYLGVVHSHPESVPEPSAQDGRAALDLLDSNPHMPAVIVGVVVARSTRRGGRHVLRLPRGELSIHVARRGDSLAPAQVRGLDAGLDFFQTISERLPRGALDAVYQTHVVVVGAGSLGSVCCEHLVRSGVPQLTVIDPDVVEGHNLTRTVYTITDVGRLKVEALADRLRHINPDLDVRAIPIRLDTAAARQFTEIISGADLVLGLADDQRALAIVDTLLYESQTAGVFAGVYRAATGGDIVTVIPGLTTCYRCTVAPRVAATDLQPGVDYTTGRLRGEVALGADVAIVAALTSRIALGVLGALRGTDQLMDLPLREGRNYLQVGLVPGFFTSGGIFDAAPAQHAFQSIWVPAIGDPDCPECGLEARVGVVSRGPRDHVRTRRGRYFGKSSHSLGRPRRGRNVRRLSTIRQVHIGVRARTQRPPDDPQPQEVQAP